ncbi:hypothetical protein EVAR_25841_1 [Eumeta japonica]|uniref:Uncharacterized protein n=1 Tax=Eumeta variegata TaxID=151549 RepID=A0A4C1VWC7_EUMVA|nr:hypothetical protein EVAR_25841_1 [Eumeta japonica]
MVSRLCGKVCAPVHREARPQRSAEFRLHRKSVGMPRITALVYAPPRGAEEVGLAPVPGAVLAVTACVEARLDFGLTQPRRYCSLSLLDRRGGLCIVCTGWGADDGSMSISGWSRATFAFSASS